jgi:hypothetical protein
VVLWRRPAQLRRALGVLGRAAWVGLLVEAVHQGEAQCQSYPRSSDAGVRWTESRQVEPLAISGIVIDLVDGRPVEGAAVYLHDKRSGAVTDSAGRFRFQAEQPGEYLLETSVIGYEPVSERVRFGAEGILAQISLRARPVPTCERMLCPDCPTAGVRVQVRDLTTGLPPTDLVTLKVELNGRADSTSAVLSGERRLGSVLFAGGGLGADGPFNVRVVAPGYATWEARDIWLEYKNCAWSPLLYAWLLPLR